MTVMRLHEIPRVPLGFWPTPLEPLRRLGGLLNIDLMVKRDDLTGFAGGGNKVRKLEFLIEDARRQGATTLITTGGVQSNHARMVAASAARFGLRAVLLLRGQEGCAKGNLLLDRMFGAEVHFIEPEGFFERIDGLMQEHAGRQRARGETPYLIAGGGIGPLGELGYFDAIRETAGQYAAMNRPPPDYLVTAAGSGGTLAGIVLGCSVFWPDTEIIGIAVAQKSETFEQRVADMAAAAARLVDVPFTRTGADIRVHTGFVGPGYGIESELGNQALVTAARTEGLILDPIYTAKAFSGLIGLAGDGTIRRGSDVLFIHTGGLPGLFAFTEERLAFRARSDAPQLAGEEV